MRKLVYILCAAAALVGLWGCQNKEEPPVKTVDLRYRVNDSYELPATGAQAFTILVASTDPWTVTSEHPDWCIISEEEGAASDPDDVHAGKAVPTTIRVQYYDNTFLDDRVDKITIKSDYWVGKVVTVTQKGSAFLTVPEEDLNQEVEKAGGQFVIHVSSNQDWSSRVTDGDWVSISEGASGTGIGTITVDAADNAAELRYAEVTVFDRHDVAAARILFTQDGVQLVPASNEIRAGYDQTGAELGITSNTAWTVSKASESDDWFSIVTPGGSGDGKVQLTFTKNEDSGLRSAEIILKNVVSGADDFQVEKTIVVKQAYKIDPVRVIVDNDEMSLWKSDWANAPTYAKGVGTTFVGKARLNRSMPFGSYTFRWSNFVTDPLTGAPRVRHWLCFSEGAEIKADIRPADAKVSFDCNTANDGNKPSIDAFTAIEDWTQPVELTIKLDPSGAEYCHVTYLVNGVEAGSWDSGPELMRTVKWNVGINMYFGVDEGGSAICEWYEYTAPMDWGD